MLLWAALLVLSAIYMHALDALPNNASGWQKLWKGIGILALLLGSAYLIVHSLAHATSSVRCSTWQRPGRGGLDSAICAGKECG